MADIGYLLNMTRRSNQEGNAPMATEQMNKGAIADAIDRQIEAASTPDPDGPACEFCGGGLAHFPECLVDRREGN